jgi:hypothetical protein
LSAKPLLMLLPLILWQQKRGSHLLAALGTLTTRSRSIAQMTERLPTDFRVEYGDKRQFKAWFDDVAKAVEFAARHHGVVVPLVPAMDAEVKR